MQLKQDKMDSFKIIKEMENPLFDRKEILIEISAKSILGKNEVMEIIEKKLSVSKDRIVIDKIEGKFGTSIFIVFAKIYSSSQEKEKIESKSKKDKEASAPKEGGQ